MHFIVGFSQFSFYNKKDMFHFYRHIFFFTTKQALNQTYLTFQSLKMPGQGRIDLLL